MTFRAILDSFSASHLYKEKSSTESPKAEQKDSRKFVHLEVLETGKIHEIFQLTLNFLFYFSTKLPSEDRTLPTRNFIQEQQREDISSTREKKSSPSKHPLSMSSLHSSVPVLELSKKTTAETIPWITSFLNQSFGKGLLDEETKEKWSRIFHALSGKKVDLTREEKKTVKDLSSYFELVKITYKSEDAEYNRTPKGVFARRVDQLFTEKIDDLIENNQLDYLDAYDTLTYQEIRLFILNAWHSLYQGVEDARGNPLIKIYEILELGDCSRTSPRIISPKEIATTLDSIWKRIRKIRSGSAGRLISEMQPRIEGLKRKKIAELEASFPRKKTKEYKVALQRIEDLYCKDTLFEFLHIFYNNLQNIHKTLEIFEVCFKRYEKTLRMHILSVKESIEKRGDSAIDFSYIDDFSAFHSPHHSKTLVDLIALEADRSRSTTRYIEEIEPSLKIISLLKKIVGRILRLSAT